MLGQIFTQTYSLKKGIKKFGYKGLYYALAEFKQLNDRTCFRKIDLNKLTSQERRQAMKFLISLTEKRDGIIKVLACANGSIQQDCMNKE